MFARYAGKTSFATTKTYGCTSATGTIKSGYIVHGDVCRSTGAQQTNSKPRSLSGGGDGRRMTNREYKAFRYLSRLWRIQREIKDKEFELWSASLASGIRYDKDNVQTSPSDPMDKIGYLIDEIRKEKEQYVKVQHKMINQIHGLEDPVYEQILVDRFIHGMTVKEINVKNGYSKPTGYRLFRKALDTFANKYETT